MRRLPTIAATLLITAAIAGCSSGGDEDDIDDTPGPNITTEDGDDGDDEDGEDDTDD